MPSVPQFGHLTLGIIGDSVTAGVGERGVVNWPRVLADRYGVAVHDHSEMGANVSTALKQVASVSTDERLVLLEIGGNDLLGEVSAERYEAGLSKLLAAVRQPGRVVVMLELPLPPTYNAYGRIQRRLAQRHRVLLVPKRVLLSILQQGDTTLDTIHLTQEGHERMADAIWSVVNAAYADGNRTSR
jgi:acyl-CoA thioesterase-1